MFLLVLVLMFLSFTDNYYYESHSYRNTIHNFSKSENKQTYDIIFFGNSHSYNSFDPRIFETELNLKSINLSGPAQRLVSTQVVANMVLKEAKPNLAIVNVFELSINENNRQKLQDSQLLSLDYIPFSWEKIKAVHTIYPITEWPSIFSQTIRFHRTWDEPKDPQGHYIFPKKYDHYKGYISLPEKMDSTALLTSKKKYQAAKYKPKKLNDVQLKRIDNIIDLFKKNEVEVLFVNAPSYASDYSLIHKTYNKLIKEYLMTKGHTILDFNDFKNLLDLGLDDFRNANHLNRSGAIKVSSYLANYIKDTLKIYGSENVKIGKNNRYYHALHKNNGLFYKKMTADISDKLFGISDVLIYSDSRGSNNILFGLKGDTLGFQKVRLEHDVSPDEIKAYGDQKIFFNKDSTKVIFWGTLSNNDVLHYKNESFAVFPFNSPLKKLRNLSFHAGDKRSVQVFRIDTLPLAPK